MRASLVVCLLLLCLLCVDASIGSRRRLRLQKHKHQHQQQQKQQHHHGHGHAADLDLADHVADLTRLRAIAAGHYSYPGKAGGAGLYPFTAAMETLLADFVAAQAVDCVLPANPTKEQQSNSPVISNKATMLGVARVTDALGANSRHVYAVSGSDEARFQRCFNAIVAAARDVGLPAALHKAIPAGSTFITAAANADPALTVAAMVANYPLARRVAGAKDCVNSIPIPAAGVACAQGPLYDTTNSRIVYTVLDVATGWTRTLPGGCGLGNSNAVGNCAGARLKIYATKNTLTIHEMAERNFRLADVKVLDNTNGCQLYADGAYVPSCYTCQESWAHAA